MHTPAPYYGTGSMTDPAEIPVKQYMPAGFGGNRTGNINTSSMSQRDNRPGMNASYRRSSSGVYSNDGLASAAAIAALYKQDPVVGAPHGQGFQQARSVAISPLPSDSDQFGMGNATEAAGVTNGLPPSPPRQRLNVSDPATEITSDAGGFNFPKTLRRQPQTQADQQETTRPAIPLSQRSLRKPRPIAQPGTTSTITSYIRLGSRQPLPSPGSVLQNQPNMVHGPEAMGPAGAKTLRGPGAKVGGDNTTANLPPPEGAAAAGLMADQINTTGPNPADIPATKTTTPSGAAHGSRPTNTGGIYTTEAQNLTKEKPINPYMPQPPAAQSDLTEDFNNLQIEGEGAYISKKTLRHAADVPQPLNSEPAPVNKVPLASKTLRRQIPEERSGSGRTSILDRLRGSQKDNGRQSQSPVQFEKFDGQNVDTTIYETMNPAVTHEHYTPQVHNVDQEVITRDIHNYDVYDRVLPVKQHVELPPRHYTPTADGKMVEIPAPGIEVNTPLQASNFNMQTDQQQQQERILVSSTKVTSPGGTTRTESVWRYPVPEEMNATPLNTPLPTSMSSNVTMTEPAPSAATISKPDTVRTSSRTPRDGDVMISQPLHDIDTTSGYATGLTDLHLPPKSPKRASSAAARAAGAADSPTLTRAASSKAGVGSVTMGGQTDGMSMNSAGAAVTGVTPKNNMSHQHIHSTGRNDLGPTHHTDIDQRRADTHEPYAGPDSESYIGPIRHKRVRKQPLRQESVQAEWDTVPQQIGENVSGDMSPVGEIPNGATSSPQISATNEGPGLRESMRNRLGSAQRAASQRMPSGQTVRTTSQRFVPTIKSRLPSLESMPSTQQVKAAAMNAQSRVAASMPETTEAVKNLAENPGNASTYAANLANNLANGIRNLMPDHLAEEVSTPQVQVPGAFDSETENYTQSDDARSSVSSDSSLSSPVKDDIEKDTQTIGGRPRVQDFENKVVPGGVVKGARALVGPAVLMESKKVEEEMSLKRLRRLSQHENVAVDHLSDQFGVGKSRTAKPMRKTMKEQDDETADKMRELQIAETERERKQATGIQERIAKNILREEHDEFERAKQIRREADRALQEAKRTKSHQDVDFAHKMEKEYQSSLRQNQKVLKENYRSGLGVTIGQGVTETSKHHSGRFDGVREGTGPQGFSPKHSTFPTGFEQSTNTAEGMMGEGTESENPVNYPSSSSGAQRPGISQPRRTTGNVITNHSVFPDSEMSVGDLKKSITVSNPPGMQRTQSQRFVKPVSQQKATQRSPAMIATQLAPGSHAIKHPKELNVQQHMTRPVNPSVHNPTNAVELDPISSYTQPIRHEVEIGVHTQAVPIDPTTHAIARNPVHPGSSLDMPTKPQAARMKTAPVKHQLNRTPSQAVPVGAFPTITQPVSNPADLHTPTQAVPIDPLSRTIPTDPLHFISGSVDPLNPLAPSPPGEEKNRDVGYLGSPTDMRAVSSTMDTLASPGEGAGMSKSQKKKKNRKKAKAQKSEKTEELDRLGVPLLDRDEPRTPSPMPKEALDTMDRAMGSPLPVKQPAGVARK